MPMKTLESPVLSTKRKYVGLQVLRIVAAGFVVLMHSDVYVRQRLDNNFPSFPNGVSGVDIFFVISGFVMIYSSQKLFAQSRGWMVFALRRITRIVPMYWLATTIKLVVMLSTTGYVLHAHFSFFTTITSYLFLPSRNSENNLFPLLGVGWTLNFEMFFYFLFSLALLLRVNVYKFVGVVLALVALGAILRQESWPAISFYLNARVLEFFLGMLIARLCVANKHLPRPVALLLFGAGIAALLYPGNLAFFVDSDWGFFALVRFGLPAAMIVYSAASLEDWIQRVPSAMLFLADSSYVIYLFHPMIAPIAPYLFSKFHIGYPWLAYGLGIALGLGVGSLVHAFVENPVSKWLRNVVHG